MNRHSEALPEGLPTEDITTESWECQLRKLQMLPLARRTCRVGLADALQNFISSGEDGDHILPQLCSSLNVLQHLLISLEAQFNLSLHSIKSVQPLLTLLAGCQKGIFFRI